MRRLLVLAGLLTAAGLAAAGPPAPAPVSLKDITASSGIDFRHTFGDRHFSKILKATGSGVGIFDYDGDGDLDIYFVNGCYLPEICDEAGKVNEGATNRLYRNEGLHPETGNLRFTDVTKEAGVGDTGYGMGCSVVDFDNDGDVDLFVTNYGPNVLYRNDGPDPATGVVRFTDVSLEAGVAGPKEIGGRPKWSTNSVWTDYDRDGWVDLYVTNYLAFDPAFNAFYGPEGFPGPLNYLGQASTLYRSRGDGTFEDVTVAAGILMPEGRGMGASAADLDGDGWPEIFEANDAMANYLFRNLGRDPETGVVRFAEVADQTLVARGQGGENTAAMHGAMGDYDGDGWTDIFIPDTSYFSLFRNKAGDPRPGAFLFDDVTISTGIAKPCGQHVGWAGFFFDYDNDGQLDIFVATGEAHRAENEPNLVLRNVGGKFVDVSLSLGERLFWEERLSRGAASADLDNDGDLDVVVVNIDVKAGGKEGQPLLMRNDGGNSNPWLQVRLAGTRSNRDGIGAKVRVTAGGRTQTADVATSPAYLSSTEARLHFGLGEAAKVDRLEIAWPSGAVQVLENLETNQLLTVTEPAAGEGESR